MKKRLSDFQKGVIIERVGTVYHIYFPGRKQSEEVRELDEEYHLEISPVARVRFEIVMWKMIFLLWMFIIR